MIYLNLDALSYNNFYAQTSSLTSLSSNLNVSSVDNKSSGNLSDLVTTSRKKRSTLKNDHSHLVIEYKKQLGEIEKKISDEILNLKKLSAERKLLVEKMKKELEGSLKYKDSERISVRKIQESRRKISSYGREKGRILYLIKKFS